MGKLRSMRPLAIVVDIASAVVVLSDMSQLLCVMTRWVTSALHSSVLELRKNQFLRKINVLKPFLEIETTHYLEGLDLKLNNETYAKVPNL